MSKFAQTWLGKFLILAAFLAVFFQFFPKLTVHAAVVLAAFTLLPNRRTLILVLSNCYFMLFSGMMFSNSRPHVTETWELFPSAIRARGLDISPDGLDTWWHRALLLLALLGFYWLYLKAAEASRLVARHPLLTIYSFLVLLLALVSNIQTAPWLCLALWAFLNWAVRWYFYMAYTAADQKFIAEKSKLLKAGSFMPFWNAGNWANLSVVPRGYRGIENTSAKTKEEFAACQWSGLKLIIWSLILHWAAQFGSRLLWQTLNMPSPPQSVAAYLQSNPAWAERWLVVMGGALNFLVSYAALSGVVIALVRMAGFRVFRNVYRPYESRDFNDFLGRLYFYYIDLIVKFYFYPCWRYSRFLSGHKSIRIFVTGFCSLSIAGLSVTFMADFPDMVEFGLLETLRRTLARAPYFFMIGILVGISSLLSRHRPASNPAFARRLMNSAFFFVLYSLCWSLQAGYQTDTLRDRMAFVLSLFGIAL